jgi:hypothetical protein|tara:strand:- start:944 stop:1252 length:309 start_codon:yes stop_codon:yes gene_type:complete
MSLDHKAIRKAYPNVVTIDDSGLILDASGNNVSVEQSKIDAARVELDKLKYQTERTFSGSTTYAPTGEQLAMIYDDIIAGKLDATGSFVAHNKAVKDANPKP